MTTAKQQAIIDTAKHHPNLSMREIGKLCDTDHAHVVRTLQRYNIVKQDADDYRKHRADILTGMQERILHSITDEDIKGMPVGQRLMGYGILFDKERLERGQSTANVDTVLHSISSELTDLIAERNKLLSGADKQD